MLLCSYHTYERIAPYESLEYGVVVNNLTPRKLLYLPSPSCAAVQALDNRGGERIFSGISHSNLLTANLSFLWLALCCT